MPYDLTNHRTKQSHQYATLEQARSRRGDILEPGDLYTIWRYSGDNTTGTGTAVDDGIYRPGSGSQQSHSSPPRRDGA